MYYNGVNGQAYNKWRWYMWTVVVCRPTHSRSRLAWSVGQQRQRETDNSLWTIPLGHSRDTAN